MPVPFTASVEQQAVVAAFLRGEDLVVQAGAGTGKSTVLALIADAQRTSNPGATAWYITFNKRNADEVMATFATYGLTNAKASTAHSLANRACRATPSLRHWVDRLNDTTLRIGDEMKLLGIPRASRCMNAQVEWDEQRRRYISVNLPSSDVPYPAQRRFLTLTRRTVEKFCQSADTRVDWQHVPSLAELPEDLRPLVRRALIDSAQSMWDELAKPTSKMGTKHSHYLKAWALSGPTIGRPGDVLLYDEAQDANPVLADAVLAQQGRVQLALVGDQNQQIYTFTGSVNAMQDFVVQPGVAALPLTECRRFGPTIAAEANAVLDRLDPAHEGIRLVGIGPAGGYVKHDYTPSETLTVAAVVCRSNALVIEHIVAHVSASRRVYSTIDMRMLERLADDVELVESGRAAQAKDVVLQGFTDLNLWRDWLDDEESENSELRDQVKVVLKYGIEQIRALARVLVTDPDAADVTVSTIHKAKGGTWDTVLVDMGEFPIEDDDVDQLRLLYVALTRARHLVLWNPPEAKDDQIAGPGLSVHRRSA